MARKKRHTIPTEQLLPERGKIPDGVIQTREGWFFEPGEGRPAVPIEPGDWIVRGVLPGSDHVVPKDIYDTFYEAD